MDETVTLRLTPAELHLIAGLVGTELAALEATLRRARDDEPESMSAWAAAASSALELHGVYGSILHRVEQALGVPFLTAEDTRQATLRLVG